MANATKREYIFVDKEVDKEFVETVMEERSFFEDRVVDGHVVKVEVKREVPVLKKVTRKVIVKEYQEQDIELTDDEQKVLDDGIAAQLVDSLITELSQRSLSTQEGGIEVKGVKVPTDLRTRFFLSGVQSLSKVNKSFTASLKDRDGNFVTLSHEDIVEIAEAVTLHMVKCFDVEAAIRAKLSTYATVEDMIRDFDGLFNS